MKNSYTVELKSNFSGHHHKFTVTPNKAQKIVHMCNEEIRFNPVPEEQLGTLEGLFV